MNQTQVTGTHLYQDVLDYAALGNHRVGTPTDAATNEWFSQKLKAINGVVTQQVFQFERFEGESTVSINGEIIPSLPLYYEGLGEISSSTPYVSAVNVMQGDRSSKALEDAITAAQQAGADIAVIATLNSAGKLATPNRYPEVQSGLPVVLIPGRYAQQLKQGKIDVQYSGKLVPSESHNVIARFGDPSKQPIIIATPLSGWFQCAAERATGISIAIELAEHLSTRYPVLVVGAPGHELLHHIGLQAYLKNNNVDASLILHLGANVALGYKDKTGHMRLAPGINDPRSMPSIARSLFVRMDADQFNSIEPALRKADLPAVLNPPKWNGEGALWADASPAPLMSFVGLGPLFHTPGDIPENVTSPELMEQVYVAIAEAVDIYMANAR